MSANHSRLSLYTTALSVIIFIVKGRPKTQTAPLMVGHYRLISPIHKTLNPGNFGVGIYEYNGKKVFIKTWEGAVRDSNYYYLRNESIVGPVLLKKLSESHFKNTVTTPEVKGVIETRNSISVVFEYIEGQYLAELSHKLKLSACKNVLDSLAEVSCNLTNADKKLFVKRTVLFHLISLTVATLLVALRYPSRVPLLVHQLVASIASAWRMRNADLKLAHGDMSLDNVLVKDGVSYIIDCGGLALSLPQYDAYCLSLKPGLRQFTNTLYPAGDIAPNALIQSYIAIHSILNNTKEESVVKHYFSEMAQSGGRTQPAHIEAEPMPMVMSNEKKLSLSVGIPAFNEGANIRKLLDAISDQHQTNFSLIETIVISDGSSDNTVEEAGSSKLPDVQVIAHTDRQGQAARQNEILAGFKGDLLVLLNGDVLPGNRDMFAQAVSIFYKDPVVGLVGIKHTPLQAKTFVESVVNFGVSMKAALFLEINGSDNLYNCRGGARVFSRKFSEKFRWDIHAAEDAYSYTRCKELGFKFYYSPDAFVFYRSPSTSKDHLRQSIRFVKSQKILHTVAQAHDRYPLPKLKILGIMLQYFIKNPLLWVSYIALYLISRCSYWFIQSDPVKYDTSKSSKQVDA